MQIPRLAVALVFSLGLTLTACGSDDRAGSTTDKASSRPATPTSPSVSSPAPESSAGALTTSVRTPELDAIGVIGHSGATGADSNGDGVDVKANSWATGDNPAVDSIYQRLLAQHPALAGHAINAAISGSDVTSLMSQATALLASHDVPDIVLVQSIDNDIACDGSDEQNYDPFEAAVDKVVAYLETNAPGIKIFFVDQWASVERYDDLAAKDPAMLQSLAGDGVCDTFTTAGKRNPKAEAYLQGLVDAYFDRIVDVCKRHPGCATDGGALQRIVLESGDVTDDYDHLTVSGLAKQAAIVWDHLPADWK